MEREGYLSVKKLLENGSVCLLLEEDTRKIYVRDRHGVKYAGAVLSDDDSLNDFIIDFLFEAYTSFQKDELFLEGLFHER